MLRVATTTATSSSSRVRVIAPLYRRSMIATNGRHFNKKNTTNGWFTSTNSIARSTQCISRTCRSSMSTKAGFFVRSDDVLINKKNSQGTTASTTVIANTIPRQEQKVQKQQQQQQHLLDLRYCKVLVKEQQYVSPIDWNRSVLSTTIGMIAHSSTHSSSSATRRFLHHYQLQRQEQEQKLYRLICRALFSTSRDSHKNETQHQKQLEEYQERTTLATRTTSATSTTSTRTRNNNTHNSTSRHSPPPPRVGIKKTKIPTPSSGPPTAADSIMEPQQLANALKKRVRGDVMPAMVTATKSIVTFIVQSPASMVYYMMHPKEFMKRLYSIQKIIQDEASHYWVGTKLLWADIQTARNLLGKTLNGSYLTRRERKQLLRTVSDIFRLVPFSIFIIIPFMEFALPFALKIFPNMLPSTFQDSLKAEENMKRELQTRIAMAKFFQETLEAVAKEQKRKATKKKEEIIKEFQDDTTTVDDDHHSMVVKQEESAASMLEFLENARKGEEIPPDVIIRYANYFQDDLTLDNMPRMQLVNMCKYMSIPPYGSNSFLSFQLRHKIRTLKEDDQRILWEGINSLTKMELREACQERGMRSTGLSKDAYKRSLQQWLDLSVHKSVPISLLIMSRTFFLQEEMFSRTAKEDEERKSLAGLADAISGLEKDIVNEVILEVATSEERMSDPSVRKIQLEVLTQQNEKIREEQAEREAAAKKKKAGEETSEKDKEKQQHLEATAAASDSVETISSQVAATSNDSVVDIGTIEFNDSYSEKVKETTTRTDASIISEIDSSKKMTQQEKADAAEQDLLENEQDLSPDELEAISQLVSSDPVSKERAELASIKAAMTEAKVEPSSEGQETTTAATMTTTTTTDGLMDKMDAVPTTELKEKQEGMATTTTTTLDDDEVQAMEGGRTTAGSFEPQADIESDPTIISYGTTSTTAVTTKTEATTMTDKEPEEVLEQQHPVAAVSTASREPTTTTPEEEEDPVVANLKKRLEKMVDKIEIQLSDVQVKIGDKLHFLDKDKDGILTTEEMIEVLQQVLKREISKEVAIELVNAMDDNRDGVITVQEFINWIETSTLVKFVEEGRDAEMDRILAKHTSDIKKDK